MSMKGGFIVYSPAISVYVQCVFTVNHAFVSGCVLQKMMSTLSKLNDINPVSVISCVRAYSYHAIVFYIGDGTSTINSSEVSKVSAVQVKFQQRSN